MTSDRRNTYVVFALILSMAVGARVLMSLESWSGVKPPVWQGDPLLVAQQGASALDIEIAYVATRADVDALDFREGGRDSLCVIGSSGKVDVWIPRGPHVWVVLIGSERDTLPKKQKRTLLAALSHLSQEPNVERVRFRLAPGSDARRSPELPAQVHDLCGLLAQKGIIR